MAEIAHVYKQSDTTSGSSTTPGWITRGTSTADIAALDLAANTKYLVLCRLLVRADSATSKISFRLQTNDDANMAVKTEVTYEMEQTGTDAFKSLFFVHSYTTGDTPDVLAIEGNPIDSGGFDWGHSTLIAIDLDAIRGSSRDVYYFDASDAGPTDSGSDWSNISNLFDGSTTTDATLANGGVSDLSGDGTTAPTSGDTIYSVVARVYGLIPSGGGALCTIHEDSDTGANLTPLNIGPPVAPVAEGWGVWTDLDAPSGGWTWQKVNDLSFKSDGLAPVGTPTLAKVEVRVESSATAGYYEDINAATGTEISTSSTDTATILGTDLGSTEAWLAFGCQKIGVGSTGRWFSGYLYGANDNTGGTLVRTRQEEGEDTAEERMIGFAARHKPSSGTPNLGIRLIEEAASANMTDEGSYLIALPSSHFADFEHEYNSGLTNHNTTENTLASVGPYTPTTGGNHLIIGNFVVGPMAGGETKVWLEDGTTETRTGDSTPTHNQGWDAAKDSEASFIMERISFSTSKTYNMNAQTVSATVNNARGRWLMVLNLNEAATPDATAVLTTLVVTGTFDAVTATGEIPATTVQTQLAVSSTFDPVTAYGPPLVQANFRVRDNDDELINSTTFSHALNTDAIIDLETRFRIRFEVDERSGASDTDTYELWASVEGGAYAKVDTNPVNWGDKTVTDLIEHVDSKQYANSAATTDVLSGADAFTAGDGVGEGGVTDSITLNNQHTEIEYALVLHRIANGPVFLEDGDTIDFRIRKADDTVLDGYTNTPRITVNVPAGLVGGTYVENPNVLGPFADGTNKYVIVEPAESDNIMLMMKSTDGGDTWAEMDGAGRPVQSDLEGVDVVQDGDQLVIFHHGGGTTPKLHIFNTSSHTTPDEWSTIDEVIDSGLLDAWDQQIAGVVRSDGSMVAAYTGDNAATAVNHDVWFNVRSSGGTWGTGALLWNLTNDDNWGVTGVLGDNDNAYFFAADNTAGDLFGKMIKGSDDSINDLFGTGVAATVNGTSVDTNVGSSNAERQNHTQPQYWNDGADKIFIAWKDDTDNDLEGVVITLGGSGSVGTVGASVNDADNVAQSNGASRQPVASVIRHSNGDFHAFFATEPATGSINSNLKHDVSTDDGATWTTDDTVTVRSPKSRINWVRAFEQPDGNIGLFYDDASGTEQNNAVAYGDDTSGIGGFSTGFIWYDEYAVAAASTAVPTALVVSSTFDAVTATGEIPATKILTTLLATSVFDPATTANNINALTILVALTVTSTLDPVIVVNDVNAIATLTALSALATFDPVTAIGEVNATTVQAALAVLSTFDPVVPTAFAIVTLTVLVVQETFDAVTVVNEVNATTVLASLVVSSTFDPVVTANNVNATTILTTLVATATFDAVVAVGEVNAVVVATVLIVTSVFDAVTVVNNVNATPVLTTLVVTATFDAVTAITDESATAVLTTLIVTENFPPAVALAEITAPATVLVVTGTFDPVVTSIDVATTLTSLVVASTFDTLTVIGEVNATTILTTLIGTATFDAVTAIGEVNDSTTLTVLLVTGTFDPVVTVNNVNATPVLTALVVQATIAATAIGEVNATTTLTTLIVTATFDAVTVTADSIVVTTVLIVTSTFDPVVATGSSDQTAALTTLIVTGTFSVAVPLAEITVVATVLIVTSTFDSVITANNINATTVLTDLVVTSIFDTPTVIGEINATTVLTTLVVQGTFDAVTAVSEVNASTTLTVLIVTSTFDAVTVVNDVNATPVLTALVVTGTFDAVIAIGEVNVTTVLTILIVQVTLDAVTAIGEVNVTTVLTTLAVIGTFDAVTVVNDVNVATTLTALLVPSVFDPAVASALNAFMRPVSDTAAAGWDSAPTASQALWAQVDEVIASDADYIFAEDPNP